jgi:predicted nucleic acid-binding Zn ribbon protein
MAVAFATTEVAWRRAYDRVPASRCERACSSLAEDAEFVPVVEIRDGFCEQCEGEIPAGRDRGTRYCSDRCRREMNYQRERCLAAAR